MTGKRFFTKTVRDQQLLDRFKSQPRRRERFTTISKLTNEKQPVHENYSSNYLAKIYNREEFTKTCHKATTGMTGKHYLLKETCFKVI